MASPPADRHEAGMVTAETAVALPVVVVVLAVALWGLSAGAAFVRCQDAAREGAREAARGETTATVRADTLRVAPAGSTVRSVTDGGLVSVRVGCRAQAAGGLVGRLGAVRMSAWATARVEGSTP
jgi:hypothetical protein